MRALKGASLILVPFACLAAAHAHSAEHHDATPSWSWEPWVIVPLALSLLLFTLGWYGLQRRSNARGYRRRAAYFYSGWLVLALALVSPLHGAGERSFAAHMVEHELIMLGAAPLLVVARPGIMLLWGFPRGGRHTLGALFRARPVRLAWHQLTEPVTATVIQAVALWGWHSPVLFDLALESEVWHAIQHASFLITALFFWTAMLGRDRPRPENYAKAGLCLFATSLISGALGALMAFSGSPWYAPYAALGMSPYGLTPAEDQQVAGLIMWIPGGFVHAAAALMMVIWLLRLRKPVMEEADVR
jgi:cytochrome c oxidase assembly factor CtaG